MLLHTGFKSDEYSGKNSIWTFFALQISNKCCLLYIDTLSSTKILKMHLS